jgi:hypothetical protein
LKAGKDRVLLFQFRKQDELILGGSGDVLPGRNWHTASTSRIAAALRRPPLLIHEGNSLNHGITPDNAMKAQPNIILNLALLLLLLCTRGGRPPSPSLHRPTRPPEARVAGSGGFGATLKRANMPSKVILNMSFMK